MSMDAESRRAIVEYRIERAYTTLEEAEEVSSLNKCDTSKQ